MPIQIKLLILYKIERFLYLYLLLQIAKFSVFQEQALLYLQLTLKNAAAGFRTKNEYYIKLLLDCLRAVYRVPSNYNLHIMPYINYLLYIEKIYLFREGASFTLSVHC